MCRCELCRRGGGPIGVHARHHGRTCRCPACRVRSAVETVAGCEGAGIGNIVGQLPAWSGWCHRTRLSDLLLPDAQRIGANLPFLRPNARWWARGLIPIYRFLALPQARQNAGLTLYFGMSFGGGSVLKRVRSHMTWQRPLPPARPRRRTASENLQQAVSSAGGPAMVQIQMGTARTRDARLAHAVEILLQRATNVIEWDRIRVTTPFDSFEGAVADTLVDLRRRA